MHVRSYLPHITSSWDNIGQAVCIVVRNELRDSATDMEKLYWKGTPSESDLIEVW